MIWRIKFLPGDLIRIIDGGKEEDAVVIAVSSYITGAPRYQVFTAENYKFSTVGGRVREINNLVPATLINRVFEPKRNCICDGDNCIIKNLLGECMDCKYKIKYSKDDTNVWFPGDILYIPSKKEKVEIKSIRLCAKYRFSYDMPAEYVTFSGTSTKWDDSELNTYNFLDLHLRLMVRLFYDCLIANGPMKISYWSEKLTIPNCAHLYKRSKINYYIPKGMNVCPMCLYQGSDKCHECITNRLINSDRVIDGDYVF